VTNFGALIETYLRAGKMESYPVDIDPAQVVRWVKAEHETSPSTFRLSATRSRDVRDVSAQPDLHLDDEEREDLTEITTVGTLEIAPAHAADGWLLRIVVEDEVGPRTSQGGMAGAAEQPIDFGTFYHHFIRSGRGSASIIGEVSGSGGRAHLAYLLQTIERNRDVSERMR
jgi:hypothetical protein